MDVGAAVPRLGEVGGQLDDVIEQLQGQISILLRHGLHRALHEEVDGRAAGVHPHALDGVGYGLGSFLVIGGGEEGVQVGERLFAFGRGFGQGRPTVRRWLTGGGGTGRCLAPCRRRGKGEGQHGSDKGVGSHTQHAYSIAGQQCGGQRPAPRAGTQGREGLSPGGP